ncbi:hypothetical protein JVU11DRAFT_7780 [Chiua virens]|nr:hypothetical protein JVU11DRAFT_7780 [Chiua virens]
MKTGWFASWHCLRHRPRRIHCVPVRPSSRRTFGKSGILNHKIKVQTLPLRLICRTSDNSVSFWTVPCLQLIFPPSGGGEGNDDSHDDVKDKAEEANVSSQPTLTCPTCDHREEPEPDGSSSEQDPSKSKSPSLPHLLSKHEDDIFDSLLRMPYVIRNDGWVCKGDKRVLWLPQHLRPLKNKPEFSAFNGKLMIVTHTQRVVVLTVGSEL